MGLIDDILNIIRGQPPQQGYIQQPPLLPPLYNQVSNWGPMFNQLWGQALPSYQGQIDPGLSPTLQNLIRMTQGYATSPAPSSTSRDGWASNAIGTTCRRGGGSRRPSKCATRCAQVGPLA